MFDYRKWINYVLDCMEAATDEYEHPSDDPVIRYCDLMLEETDDMVHHTNYPTTQCRIVQHAKNGQIGEAYNGPMEKVLTECGVDVDRIKESEYVDLWEVYYNMLAQTIVALEQVQETVW